MCSSCGCDPCEALLLTTVPGADGRSVINYGPQTVDPTTAPANGAGGVWFNTVTGHLWFFPTGGTAWVDGGLIVGTDGTDGTGVELTFDAADPASPGDDPASGNSAIWFNTTSGHVWEFPIGGPWSDEGLYRGADGAPGLPATTLVAAAFTMPSSGNTVDVLVTAGEAYFATVGATGYVVGAGYMIVTAVNTGTDTVTLRNAGYTGNAIAGATIGVGNRFSLTGPIGPTGVAGAAGTPGAAGTTPTFRSGSVAPANSLGVDGDVYIHQVNPGRLQFYFKQSGAYVAPVTGYIIANRMMGTGNTDPNLISISGMNTNDYYWTVVGTTYTYWVYNGTTWVAAFSFTTGGGSGGSDTFTTVAANSTAGAYGQLTGTYNWMLERTIVFSSFSATISSPGTYQFDLTRPKTILTCNADPTLNISAYAGDGEWTFELYNPSASVTRAINYSSNVWYVNQGVAQPTLLGPGERIQLICRKHNAKITIITVIANTTLI